MKTTQKLKSVSIDTLIDKHIGNRGTEKRELFENELRLELLVHCCEQKHNVNE